MLFQALLLALIPAALAVDYQVIVGVNQTLTYMPHQVFAAIGDTITFTVLTGTHTITRASFDGAVCPPPIGGFGPDPFDSGYLVATDAAMPSYTYTVADTCPHFISCTREEGRHCRAGMTFAINPTAYQTYEQFEANAMAS